MNILGGKTRDGLADDAGQAGAVSAADLAALSALSDDALFDQRWSELERSAPGDPDLWEARVRHLTATARWTEASEFVAAMPVGDDLVLHVRKAEMYRLTRDTDASIAAFDACIERFPDDRETRLHYAKRLFQLGQLVKAWDLVTPVRGQVTDGSKGHHFVEMLGDLLALLERLEGRALVADDDGRILAMKHAILSFRDRAVPAPSGDGVGRLTLITGSLGPGGAERQLTRLGTELTRAWREGTKVGGLDILEPPEIVVRSHGPEKQNDFFLKDVVEGGVDLVELDRVGQVDPLSLVAGHPERELLFQCLPASVTYGLRRLAPHLAQSRSEVVSAWQDGACLFVGLAALVVGVPSIQLAVRGLPPVLRRHLFRPEYEWLYKAMAEVPGVSFISNNFASAKAYAEWLDIPVERFAIVYNGVQPMTTDSTEACEAMWREFDARTADCSHTVGGVFRFDTDKQPTLWIRFAQRYLKKHPDARFVLVGGGRLLEQCQDLARELGVAERILFTDRSKNVGAWMARMDALLLLSRYEGLPNVLIEAQFMGVRVVTTPAGGAAECLIDGVTGHVLDCCIKPDLKLAVDMVHTLARRRGTEGVFAPDGVGQRFLEKNFSIGNMLGNYVTATWPPAPSAEMEGAPAQRVA